MRKSCSLLDGRIERLRHGADLRNGCVTRIATTTAATTATDSRGCLTSLHALAVCDGTRLRGAARHARQSAARFRTLELPCKRQRRVAGHLDIDVVFKRERDRIVRREIKLASADEALQPLGIPEPNGRNGRLHIWPLIDVSNRADGVDRSLRSRRRCSLLRECKLRETGGDCGERTEVHRCVTGIVDGAADTLPLIASPIEI